jgi:DNA polymerase-3 subunit epsilon
MLRETGSIDHVRCATPLEAAVLEVRMIHALDPRYNRQHRRWRSYTYLKLTAEPFPRLSVVRSTAGRSTGPLIGPFPSAAVARLAADAIESAVPIRRCTGDPSKALRSGLCGPAQLGVALCPCAGDISVGDYHQSAVAPVLAGLGHEPELLLGPLRSRMQRLAQARRYEEAADVRDRAAALGRVLRRQRRFDALRFAGRVVVELADRSGAELRRGALVRAWAPSATGSGGQLSLVLRDEGRTPEVPASGPLPRDQVDELAVVASWLEHNAGRLRLLHVESGLAWPLPWVAGFEPVRGADRLSRVATRSAA